jgi:ATP-dependent Clp protease protease subunit
MTIATDARHPTAAATQAFARQLAAKTPWCRIEASAGAREATVFVYGYIVSYAYFDDEISADGFVRRIENLEVDTLHVRINSGGGDVFQGLAIYNALKRHAARVVIHVDGVAASIASVIAMAGDEVLMGEGSFLMIHEPATCACGTADELRQGADVLDKVRDAIASIYASRTGNPVDGYLPLMKAETWYTAAEAIGAGLADSLDLVETSTGVTARLDLSFYARVPEALRATAGTEPADTLRRPAPTNVRELEKFLRDEGGFSRQAAKAIASRGLNAPHARRDDGGAVDPPVRLEEEVSQDIDALQAAVLTATLGMKLGTPVNP